MLIWIVRKHPPMPYRSQAGHLEAFTIHSSHSNHASAANKAKDLNQRSQVYLYTVGKIQLKEQQS